MYLDIYEAIEHHCLVQLYYGDYTRIIEPRTYGSDLRGRDVVKAYQIAGCDALGRHVGWKWFHAADMYRVSILGTHFVTQRDISTLRERPLRRVYCEVHARPDGGGPGQVSHSNRHR
jgi:hypothetical protein